MNTLQQEIERLVDKFPWDDSKEIFRAELQYLVEEAEKMEKERIDKALRMQPKQRGCDHFKLTCDELYRIIYPEKGIDAE